MTLTAPVAGTVQQLAVHTQGGVVTTAQSLTKIVSGSVFVAYVKLATNRLYINQRWFTLTPGMSIRAEITTGKRQVINYFLGPLIKLAQEGLRER